MPGRAGAVPAPAASAEVDLGVQREARHEVGGALGDLVGDLRVQDVLGLGGGALAGGAGLGGREDAVDETGDLVHLAGAQAARGQRGGADADAGGVPGAVGVGRGGGAVGDDARVEQGGLGLTAGEAVGGGDVDQVEVVVGAAGDQGGAAARQPLGEGAGVVHDALGVVLEVGAAGLGQGDRLGGHHVREGAAEDHR